MENDNGLKRRYLVLTTRPEGNLDIFTIQTEAEVILGIVPKEYYWQDAGSPQGFGPFRNVGLAFEDYKAFKRAKQSNLALVAPMAQVIEVDFLARKRLKHEDI